MKRSYYQFINGIRYARDLLDAARRFASAQSGSRISIAETQALYQMAEDGYRITDTERRTLLYIAENFRLTDKARQWLEAKMGLSEPRPDLEAAIARIVRVEQGLKQLSWQIDAQEVSRQEQLNPTVLFEAALRGAFDAYLYRSISPLSFAAFVARRDLSYGEYRPAKDVLHEYLDRGRLALFPLEAAAEGIAADAALLESLELENNWAFGLQIPDFEHVIFLAKVLRNGANRYSYAAFSRQSPLENMIPAIIHNYAGVMGLQWDIDPEEVARQLALYPGQNFGNALFAVAISGFFNGESSMSFMDFIQMEVWPDPDLSREHYMRQYLNFGKLYLIPLDYRERMEAGTLPFPLPEYYDPWIEGQWIFGLEMPRKTQVRFIVNAPRDFQDGYTAWIDGFVLAELPFAEQLQQVLDDDFQLPELRLSFPEAEFDAQREQYGPDWRYASGLLRQALYTAMDDYLTPGSLFQAIAQTREGEDPAEDFDDPLEYRAAVRHDARGYLQTAVLELLPRESPERQPPNGEPIENNWLFCLQVPHLSEQAFWIVIPRWPDDEERPYSYAATPAL